jgi:hypothetical protein
MAEPRVPGASECELELPCGERIDVRALDMGLREYDCDCGAAHAVVMDMHPLSRFVPEELVRTLETTVETAEGDAFGTMHLMGMTIEEFPDRVASADTSENGDVGFALVWAAEFDARRLHEVVVELVVELMDHAVSHAEDDEMAAAFEEQMLEFDIGVFVDQYRAERNFEDEHDSAV